METYTTSAVADDHRKSVKQNGDSTHDVSDDVDDFKKGVKYLVETHAGLKKLPQEYVLPLPSNPLSAAHGDVPLIDLSGLAGSTESRISTIRALSSACADWGFFRIANHGIEVGLMEEMMKVTKEFFDLSLAEKMKYTADDVMSPLRYGTSLNTTRKHALHWRDFFRHYGRPSPAYPDNPPNYRIVAKEYMEQMWALAGRLGEAISEGLGLDPGYIDEKLLGDGSQILAANYYPPCPEPDKTLGLAGHSDHGAITILMDNGVEGLQVKHNGEWVAVGSVPATFVVNLGDSVEVLTNGKYKSVEHRGTVNAEKARISVAVARGPSLSRWLAPASQLVEEGEAGPMFQPILYSEYIRLQQTITARGKSALDAIRTNG